MPNRGHRLFLLIEEGPAVTVVTMMPPEREIYARWNKYDPTYDFVSAVVSLGSDGSKVIFTRNVMKNDCIPRAETLELFFPYTKQPHYRFFDIGTIVGFYRNSENDFDPRELWPQIPQVTFAPANHWPWRG
jgi:hypothetical protein